MVRLLATAVAVVPALALAQAPPLQSLEFGPGEERAVENSSAPAAVDKAKRRGALGLRVRSIRIEGRWADKVTLPVQPCELLTPEKVSAAMNAVEREVTRTGALEALVPLQGEIEVLLVEVDFDTTPGPADACPGAQRTVGMVLRPYHVRIALAQVGDNLLPIPRSPFASFYRAVPKPLLALQPRAGMSYDRAFGSAMSAEISTDLLALAEAKKQDAPSLDLRAAATKSVDASFYRADAALDLRFPVRTAAVKEYRMRIAGDASLEPLPNGEYRRSGGEVGGGVTIKPAAASRLWLDSAWKWSDERVTTPGATASETGSHLLANRVLLDHLVRPTVGFLRAGLWADFGRADEGSQSFQQLAGRAGYAQEIRVHPAQTLGLEVVLGAGTSWGEPPAARRYFGGNSATQFLYDGPSSRAMLDLPRGPLIRSFGQNQAGLASAGAVVGGRSFWHVNLNLAIPIRRWSRPLIPDEEIDLNDAQGNPLTLKKLLMKQVDVTGPNMLAATLVSQGTKPAEAFRQANAALDEIRPAANYIINDAYLLAVRPLLMLDAAGLSGSGASAHWVAVGAGIGITVVTARFEAGYMHTVSGPLNAERRGAAFLRLVFQNLF